MELDTDLQRRLEAIRRDGLTRALRRIDSAQSVRVEVDGSRMLNFSSNDYLGLATHPQLLEASTRAVRQYGAGSASSRLICGGLRPHADLEEALATFKGSEAVLTFSSGYAAALGAVTTLLEPGDRVVLDRLAHACLVDAARLSRAEVRVFEHNDPDSLKRVLNRYAAPGSNRQGSGEGRPRVLVMTESVFSMDGDVAPLREIVEVKERFGAWLMVDEAHATGLYGGGRCGLVDEFGLSDRVEVQLGTLGKALGAAGGFVSGSRRLIDLLINRARSLIFSTAPVPAAVAAAQAAVEIVQSEEGRDLCDALWGNIRCLSEAIRAAGFEAPATTSPILPVVLGDEGQAVALADALRKEGVYVPAIRFPSVGRGKARLRFTASALQESAQFECLTEALSRARSET